MRALPKRARRDTTRPPVTRYRARPAAAEKSAAAQKSWWDKAGVIVQSVAALAVFVSLGGLFIGVLQFNEQQRATAAQNLDQQRQDTLNEYFDDMSTLVLQDKLPGSKPGSAVRAIAEARTFTTVRDLDGVRKSTLIRYLVEASLITGADPIISLQGADLNGADFQGTPVLNGIDLTNLSMTGATLVGAALHGADLQGSVLSGTDMNGSQLTCIPPSGTSGPVCVDLRGADLSGAYLSGADLMGARLSCLGPGSSGPSANCTALNQADLSNAYLIDTDLNGAMAGGVQSSESGSGLRRLLRPECWLTLERNVNRGAEREGIAMIRRFLTTGLTVIAALTVMSCSAHSTTSAAPNAHSSNEALNLKSGTGGGILMMFGGIGPGGTPLFIVPTSRVSVQYTFNCSSLGAAGTFSATLIDYQSG